MEHQFDSVEQTILELFAAFKFEEARQYVSEFLESIDWSEVDPNIHFHFLFYQFEACFKQVNAVKSGEVKEHIDTLFPFYESQLTDMMKGRYYLTTVQIKIARKDMSDIESILFKCITIFERHSDLNCSANAYMSLGAIKKIVGDLQASEDAYWKAISILEQINNNSIMANAFVFLGMIKYDVAQFDRSFDYYYKALTLYEQEKNLYGKCAVLVNLGNLYRRLSNNQKALEYYGKALDLNHQLNRKTGIATVNNSLGNIYSGLKEFERAIIYYEHAISIYEELGNKDPLFFIFMNIGYVYLQKGEYDRAKFNFQKAFTDYHVLGNHTEELTYHINMGLLYIETKEYDLAWEHNEKGYNLSNEKNNDSRKYEFLSNLAMIEYTRSTQSAVLDSALEKLLICFNHAEMHELKKEKSRYADHIAKVYTFKEDWKNALTYHQIFHHLELELNNRDYVRQAEIIEYNRKLMDIELMQQTELTALREQAKLLHEILPSTIAERIIAGEKSIAEETSSVSIFFSDIVGFTAIAESIAPSELVKYLNELFSMFDNIAHKHGIEKIKTIGDSYMAVCGIPEPKNDHAIRMAEFAKEIMSCTNAFIFKDRKIEMRIGIHAGTVVAGVIGLNRYSYDLWGDAVNIASRMESTGLPGKIQISESFVHELSKGMSRQYTVVSRGEVEMKGKGFMRTYFLN